jgi:hypothetical protein
LSEHDITGFRKDRGIRWINWRSVRFFITVGIVSTVISHFSEGETRSIAKTLTESELWNELQSPGNALGTLVKELEDSVCIGDPAPFTATVDHDSLFDRATSGVAPGEDADRIRTMFRRGTFAAWQGTPLVQESLGKQFRFLRPRTIEGHEGLLFRSADDEGSLNYFLLMMGKTPEQEFRIRDIFVVGVHETISKTLSRTYRHLVAEFAKGNAYDSIVEDRAVSTAFVQNLSVIAKMNQHFQSQDYASLLQSYELLPEPAQRAHKPMLMRVEATEHLGSAKQDAAMREWKNQFHGDHTLPLKFIDFYAAKGDYDSAERLVRQLDQTLGGDSYLRFRLGEILLAKEVSPNGLHIKGGGREASRRTSSRGRRGGRGRAAGK